ncbi:Asp23/Gls24 family envelope stress response protein [Frondihabitans cladoniiphilus]|uniref:Alkaline shock family protein YloU n=1 Tax=Frondihabitans cladoniiphilus TaxID=715785 RepID=A0ABP8VLE9_9MICO
MSTALYKRVLRRETHSSRSGVAIVLAVILIVVFAWAGTESVLAALERPALLVSPKDAAVSVLGAASGPVGLLTAAGVVAAVIGIILIVVSFAPGRRGRRGVDAGRTAVLVDDRVIAQSVSRSGAYAGDVDPSQVKVTVGKRTVDVDVTRTSGRTADVRSIQDAVNDELSSYDFSPTLRGKVRLSKKAEIA